MTRLTIPILIAVGGAVGSLARYGTQLAFDRSSVRSGFPIGTLVANLVGCLLVGYVHGLLADKVLREEMRFLLVVGFLGGFTTFSSYGWETFERIRTGHGGTAMLYVLLSNALAIVLVMAGYQLSRLHT
jgi:fluoride exporter